MDTTTGATIPMLEQGFLDNKTEDTSVLADLADCNRDKTIAIS